MVWSWNANQIAVRFVSNDVGLIDAGPHGDLVLTTSPPRSHSSASRRHRHDPLAGQTPIDDQAGATADRRQRAQELHFAAAFLANRWLRGVAGARHGNELKNMNQ
jgi:hypothetical protein